MQIQPFNPRDTTQINALAALWNAACGPDLSMTPRFMRYNTDPAYWNGNGRLQAGWLAVEDGRTGGFALASLFKEPYATPPYSGHVDAIAVDPSAQRRGAGSALLQQAEGWLRAQGCQSIWAGASSRPFVPGPPEELGSAAFFQRRGYGINPDYGWSVDMAHDLAHYTTPPTAQKAAGVIARPCESADVEPMLDFLRREFPGGWHLDAEEQVRNGWRLSDYVVLWSERGVEGCCHVNFEDSARPLDRFYMHRLPHPWGQLGAIGVSADRRGQGYGAVLLDGGLRHLRDNGVRGCIIDWLVLVDFYARFGFKVFRKYLMMRKERE
jgi:GNAT superfamily N-acetyltransferase